MRTPNQLKIMLKSAEILAQNDILSLLSSPSENTCTDTNPMLIKLGKFKSGKKRILREFSENLEDKNSEVHERVANQEKKPLNRGRWTRNECKLFEEGLKNFGRNWKKMEAFVGTRSGTQIRSHAQKYFLREKDKTESQESDLTFAPTLSLYQKTQNCINPELPCLNTTDIGQKPEVAKYQQNSSTHNEANSYLLTYMKIFGFHNMEDIYASYVSLSDWVNTSA